MNAFNELSKVKFGYLIFYGGDHTALFSYGMVFEVHWGGCGTGLYERSPFYGYPATSKLPWLSGIVLLPPDSGFSARHMHPGKGLIWRWPSCLVWHRRAAALPRGPPHPFF